MPALPWQVKVSKGKLFPADTFTCHSNPDTLTCACTGILQRSGCSYDSCEAPALASPAQTLNPKPWRCCNQMTFSVGRRGLILGSLVAPALISLGRGRGRVDDSSWPSSSGPLRTSRCVCEMSISGFAPKGLATDTRAPAAYVRAREQHPTPTLSPRRSTMQRWVVP